MITYEMLKMLNWIDTGSSIIMTPSLTVIFVFNNQYTKVHLYYILRSKDKAHVLIMFKYTRKLL